MRHVSGGSIHADYQAQARGPAFRRVRSSQHGIRRGFSIVAVVDDEEAVRQPVSSPLESAGWQAIVFYSAETDLRFGDRHKVKCAMVDFRMSAVKGLELLSILSELDASIPIVIESTGYVEVLARALGRCAAEVLGERVRG